MLWVSSVSCEIFLTNNSAYAKRGGICWNFGWDSLLYRANIEGFTSSSLTDWNESTWFGPQIQEFLLLSSSWRDWVNSVILCVKLANWLIMPMKRLNSQISVGACILTMVATFSESGLMLSWSIRWPRNLTFLLLNTHFTGFNVTPASSSLLKTAYNLVSCYLLVFTKC